jgi:hypothetical protein
MKARGVDFFVCGLEYSGTTLVSDLFRQIQGCDSGFECGVQLADSPRDFHGIEPFYGNMRDNWDIDPIDLSECCETDSFEEFYARLYERSNLFSHDRPPIRFDKTPRYIIELPLICRRHPATPFVVMMKDPRSIVYSDFVRASLPVKEFWNWYKAYLPSKKCYMSEAFDGYLHAWSSPQCLVVRLEDLCLSTRETVKRVFSHIGFAAMPHHLIFEQRRYKNNFSEGILASAPFQYLRLFNEDILAVICEDFSEFDQWFYAWQ